MKFPAHALHQLIVLGTSCIFFAASENPDGVVVPTRNTETGSTRLRGRELSSDNTISIDTVQISYTWQPSMELDVSVSCEAQEAGRCMIQPSTPFLVSLPNGYGDDVLREVCKNGHCMTLFSPTSDTTNTNCLTIPDGYGQYRGIKLSPSKGFQATISESGKVKCSDGPDACRTDYSWVPGMTLAVNDDDGSCKGVAGCMIDGDPMDAVCAAPSGSIELARPTGYRDHVVEEVYSSAWINGAVKSFHAASDGSSNIEDCLTRRVASTEEYGGIKLSSNSYTTIQAVVSEDGSVYCRSLSIGSSCINQNQCLTNICKPFENDSNRCDDALAAFGEYCRSDSDCESDDICNSNVNRCDDKQVGEFGAMCSDNQHCTGGACLGAIATGTTLATCDGHAAFGEYCNSDSDCEYDNVCNSNVNRCDNKQAGEFRAMCSDNNHCTGGACVGDIANGTTLATCDDKLENGKECDTGSDCLSDICIPEEDGTKKCSETLAGYNEKCESDSHCEPVRPFLLCNRNVNRCDKFPASHLLAICNNDADCCGLLKCKSDVSGPSTCQPVATYIDPLKDYCAE